MGRAKRFQLLAQSSWENAQLVAVEEEALSLEGRDDSDA
jgi:hypothetical protein